MRYVLARADETRRERAYRIYVTDGLKTLCGFETRYADMVNRKPVSETRSAYEIISDIKDKVNVMGKAVDK